MAKQSNVILVSAKEERAAAKAAKQRAAEALIHTRIENEVSLRVNTHLVQFTAEEMKRAQSSVIEQVRMALCRENALSMVCGAILGGFIPIATFLIVHHDLPLIDLNGPILSTIFRLLEVLLVIGGLVFSAKTCVAWTSQAFQDRVKAIAWVVLLEGVMILSPIHHLSMVGLGLLVAINGIATGCNLALNRKS